MTSTPFPDNATQPVVSLRRVSRIYGEGTGIGHVLVNGVPCVEAGELLDARPGTLLRSGRDTDTVTAR